MKQNNTLSRRNFVIASSLGGAASLIGCAGKNQHLPTTPAPIQTKIPTKTTPAFVFKDFEKPLLSEKRADFTVVTRDLDSHRVLRTTARSVCDTFDFTNIAARMKHTMNQSKGVGIAGPQVGLSLCIATLMLNYKTKSPHTIFVQNPKILERSDDSIEGYEGCLSIPGVGGMVRRNRWIQISYQDINNDTITTKAEGPNAVLWQHELDHLFGVLYVDRLLDELLPMDEVKKRRAQKDAFLSTNATSIMIA